MANGFVAAALAADSCAAVEPDFRWRGAWASGLRLPLARSTDRGARFERRARSATGHTRGAGDPVGRRALAASTGRAACCRSTGSDSFRVTGAARTSDRSLCQAHGRSQAKAKRRGRCGHSESAPARRRARRRDAHSDPGTARHRRGALQRGRVGRAPCSIGANV